MIERETTKAPSDADKLRDEVVHLRKMVKSQAEEISRARDETIIPRQQMAERVVRAAKGKLDAIYHQGWGVTKEAAFSLLDEVMTEVARGTPGASRPESLQTEQVVQRYDRERVQGGAPTLREYYDQRRAAARQRAERVTQEELQAIRAVLPAVHVGGGGGTSGGNGGAIWPEERPLTTTEIRQREQDAARLNAIREELHHRAVELAAMSANEFNALLEATSPGAITPVEPGAVAPVPPRLTFSQQRERLLRRWWQRGRPRT